jgi:NAD+ kinase
MAAVLLVTKTPLARRLAPVERARMEASGVLTAERLNTSEERQEEALLAVRAALAGLTVHERRVDALTAGDADGVELVVTVGGDGTVFTANTLPTRAPYLTVNSDPERSVGHFTRFTAGTVAAGVTAWRHRLAGHEELHRLAISVGGSRHMILNDCLFAHSNPAVLCRYVLEVDGQREFQRSSGVWVSTAHGSTAAIRSAGSEPVPGNLAALLFRVREPFLAREPVGLLAGTQLPPRGLRLTPAIPGMALYLDGPNVTVPVQPGLTVEIAASPDPLRLITAHG